MWEAIQSSAVWGGVGIGAAWFVTACLLVAGAVGCVLPILPGHVILIIAAVAHRLMLGREGSGLEWWSFVILGLLAGVSQLFETLSGAAGTKWFGGTRWGALGALGGSIVGMFFMPFGLLVGPLVGAFACEIAVARRHPKPAAISGVGSVVGTLAGMGVKIVVGVLMITWFFVDIFFVE